MSIIEFSTAIKAPVISPNIKVKIKVKKYFHVGLVIGNALSRPDELDNVLSLDGNYQSSGEAVDYLTNLSNMGHKLLCCVGDECNGFDPFLKGCPGHEIDFEAHNTAPIQYCISIEDEERFPHGPYDTESEAVLAAVDLNKTEYGGEYDSFLIGESKSSKNVAFSNIDHLSQMFFEDMSDYLTEEAGAEEEFAYFSTDDRDEFENFLFKLFDTDRYNYKGIIQKTKRIEFKNVGENGSYSECIA